MATLEAGDPERPALILLHGNVSSSVFWRDTIEHFAKDYHVWAPDLRGFRDTEPLPIDARRGLLDWVEDLHSRRSHSREASVCSRGLVNGRWDCNAVQYSSSD
ncbi:alpha/beta fold hydrolase [Alicyclobacillus cycloheptanicus]|nr:alpha/beta fold hydrolase [Alicyclobacillus cycloheptanicus]